MSATEWAGERERVGELPSPELPAMGSSWEEEGPAVSGAPPMGSGGAVLGGRGGVRKGDGLPHATLPGEELGEFLRVHAVIINVVKVNPILHRGISPGVTSVQHSSQSAPKPGSICIAWERRRVA